MTPFVLQYCIYRYHHVCPDTEAIKAPVSESTGRCRDFGAGSSGEGAGEDWAGAQALAYPLFSCL